jgi:ribokinase
MAIVTLENNDDAAAQFQLQMWARNRAHWTMLNAAPAAPVSPDLRAASAIVVANDIEASALAGLTVGGPADVPDAQARIDCRLLVVTFGAAGSAASMPGSRVHAPAFDVRVVDTTGAGDAFCGAFAVRLTEGAELADAMRFANAAGAVACTRHGAYESMPAREDVEALLAGEGASR